MLAAPLTKSGDKLFAYQTVGAKWLSENRFALLFDEMGLGKSAQSIEAARLTGAKSILVICKAVARANWLREFERWWPSYENDGANLTITSYESFHKVSKHIEFDTLIIDEAHTLKNPKAKRTQQILGKNGPVHKVKHVWALTGTPTPNHAGELWVWLFTFGLTKLSYDDFVSEFCKTRKTTYGLKIQGTNTHAIPKLKQIIKNIVLRRTKESVNLELPPIYYQDLIVEPQEVKMSWLFGSVVWDKYTTVRDKEMGIERLKEDLKNELGILDGIIGESFTLESMRRMEECAKSIATLRRYTGLQKIGAVTDMVREELRSNAYDKIVIFAVHVSTIEALTYEFKDEFRAVRIFGGTARHRVVKFVDRFQEEKDCRVMIANIQAAGTSITLTAGTQVLFVEQTFVPADMLQAAMRCHRVGQTKPVTVRFMGLANSVDQYIAQVIRRKTAELSQLMDGLGVELSGQYVKAPVNS